VHDKNNTVETLGVGFGLTRQSCNVVPRSFDFDADKLVRNDREINAGSTEAHLHLLNQQSLRAAPYKTRELALYEISQKTFADLQVVQRIALGGRLI
jgi:hypothetical protein